MKFGLYLSTQWPGGADMSTALEELVAQVRELIAYELAREADEAPETVRSARDAYEPLPERPVAVRVVAA